MAAREEGGQGGSHPRDCAHCGAAEGSIDGTPTHRACGGCGLAFYCGKPCQTAHWNSGNHRRYCVKPSQRRVATAAAAMTCSPSPETTPERCGGFVCVICQEDLRSDALPFPCGHMVHQACGSHLQECPLCRLDVSKASLHPTTVMQKKLRDSMTPLKVPTPEVPTPVGLRLRIAGLQVATHLNGQWANTTQRHGGGGGDTERCAIAVNSKKYDVKYSNLWTYEGARKLIRDARTNDQWKWETIKTTEEIKTELQTLKDQFCVVPRKECVSRADLDGTMWHLIVVQQGEGKRYDSVDVAGTVINRTIYGTAYFFADKRKRNDVLAWYMVDGGSSSEHSKQFVVKVQENAKAVLVETQGARVVELKGHDLDAAKKAIKASAVEKHGILKDNIEEVDLQRLPSLWLKHAHTSKRNPDQDHVVWYAFLRVLVKVVSHDQGTNIALKLWPEGINKAMLHDGNLVCYSPIMVVRLIGKRGVAFDAKHCVLTTFESPTLAFDMLRTFSDAARATARRLVLQAKDLLDKERYPVAFLDREAWIAEEERVLKEEEKREKKQVRLLILGHVFRILFR